MALSEEQIVRFSRQILLKEVGGVGQARLLAARVRLHGAGAALSVAADYLAAAGVAIEPPARAVQDDEVGFGRARAEVGRPWAGGGARSDPAGLPSASLDATLPPDSPGTPRSERAAAAHRARGCLVQLPAPFELEDFAVVIGSREGAAVIAFTGPNACRDCFARTVAGWGAPPGHLGALVGAAAAQLGVRLILGLETALGVRQFQPNGAAAVTSVSRCDACARRG